MTNYKHLQIALKRSSTTRSFAILLAQLFFTPSLYAQATINPENAQSIRIGETNFYPALQLSYLSDSNTNSTTNNELQASAASASPELIWIADKRAIQLQMRYLGDYSTSERKVLSFVDHYFEAQSRMEFSKKQRGGVDLQLQAGHQKQGTNLTYNSGNTDQKLVTYNQFGLSGFFTYGGLIAKGNITGGLRFTSFSYTSRKDLTAGKGNSKLEPTVNFSLRISGDTRIFTEFRIADVNFETESKNRVDTTLLTGLTFRSTGKTGGSIGLGLVQTNHENHNLVDKNVFTMEGLLFWEPSKYSRFSLELERGLDNVIGQQDTNSNDSASVKDLVEVIWTYNWSSRTNHTLTFNATNFDVGCPNNSTLTTSGSAEIFYNIRRWLRIGFAASSISGDTNRCTNEQPVLDYNKTTFATHIRATL